MNATSDPPAAEAEAQAILEAMPAGAIRFRGNGAIELTNSLGARLLEQLADGPRHNIFAALSGLVPDLPHQVAASQHATGEIIDQRRLVNTAGGQILALTQTITRLGPDRYLAILKDTSVLTEMAACAFATADILIGLNADGRIRSIRGASRLHFGLTPDQAVGLPLADLVSPRDRMALRGGLAVLTDRGRMPPMLARLVRAPDRRPDQCPDQRYVIAGLAMEGGDGRYMLTIGPEPRPAHDPTAGPVESEHFARDVEASLRDGQPSVLGLLDVRDWAASTSGMAPEKIDSLKQEIGRLGGGRDVTVGELGDGHFGVLAPPDTDLRRLGAALGELVGDFAQSARPDVGATRVDLRPGVLPLEQCISALRLVLGRFGAGGIAAGGRGLAGGLAGIIEEASGHKRALAAMIGEGRFDLLYQPIVDLRDRSVHHHEALLRVRPDVRNPSGGTQEFVTLVETVGLARDLDLAVLRRACTTLDGSAARAAVNVSGHSIADPAYIDLALRTSAGLAPGQLLIELTETAEVSDAAAAAAQIDRLQAGRIPVCLDDFGAGHASFGYIRDFHVDHVKIDGSFVRAAGQGDRERSFVVAMTDMAASAKASVIAETIETEADAALMLSLGVTFGQGWLFGKPGHLPEPPQMARRGSRLQTDFADRFRHGARR